MVQAYLRINGLRWACSSVCVCANFVFTWWCTDVLHIACVLHMSFFSSLFCWLGLEGSDLTHMCRIIHSQWMRVYMCGYIQLLLFLCLSLMGHCTQNIWTSIHACIWCQVCLCASWYWRLCVCWGVRAFAIYFSEWVAKQSYASCVSVRPLSVCWLWLHVCAGASWSVSWLALDGELEESRGERGDLQKRHAPLPPLLLFLLLLLLLCLALPFSSLTCVFSLLLPPPSRPLLSLHFTTVLLYKNCLHPPFSNAKSDCPAVRQNCICVTEPLSIVVIENHTKWCIQKHI